MTAQDRKRHERNQQRQNPALPTESRASAVEGHTDTWLAKGTSARQPGVVWLKRPMPDGQWPVDQRAPRDDSFSWWVRSHCGHEGGSRQWAFYEEGDADTYEGIFRESPCLFTRCPQSTMIKNQRGR